MTEVIERLIQGSGGGSKKGGSGENANNTLQSNSIIRFVELISEGPCEGLVGDTDEERSKSIYFDRTPIRNKNGSVNYKHVKWSQRLGTPDQPVLKNFSKVETPYEVNVQVTKNGGPHEVVIDNENASSILAIVRLPALVKQKKKSGTLEKTSVRYRFDVKPTGDVWQIGDVIEIDDEKTTSAWQKAHRIDLPDNGNPWLVRMVRITDDAEDEKTANETWWDSYNVRYEGRFVYPHSALIAMEVNAEDMGSQLPARNYRFRGLKIRVPSNYDPITRRYTGNWDGTFKTAWTNNPAWIFYDLLTNDRYGLGEFVKPALVDKWTLYAIGQYCDERVKSGYFWSDGTAKYEPRYTFNGVIRDREDAWRVLQNIASTWRGMAYWSLNQVFATIDKPEDPVKLLTPANVIDGAFDYQGTAKKARYSVALVTFNDKENFYQPSVQPVVNESLLQKYGWREKQVQLQGCTDRSLANRYGEWLLDTAENETETVTFSASWENADIRPGNIIAIADPRKANARMGGRIAAATLNHVTFDAPVPRTPGENYTLMVVMPNGNVVERNIDSWNNQIFEQGISQGYLECSLASDLPNEPVDNATFIVKGSNIAPRMYRVISMKEEEKNIFSVIALFHDPTKYARVERGKNLQPPPYTLPDAETPAPTNLKVKEQVYLDDDGRLRAHLDVSWDRPRNRFAVKDFVVTMIHPRNGKRRLEPTTRNHITIENAVPGDYTFSIVGRSYLGGVISDPLEGTITVQGAASLPLPKVTNLELEEDEGQTTFNGNSIAITWKNKFARSNDPTADDAVNVEDFSSLFKYNLVKIYDTASDSLLRQFRVREPRYVYRFKDNRRDNAKAGRSPSREVRFRVTAVDQLERSSLPVDFTCNNVAPPQLNFTVTQRGDTMQLNIVKPDADDVDGYLVWMSKTAGFTPSGTTEGAGNCVYDGNSRKPVIDVERGQDYYVICAAYDDFGKQSLNYSAQVHTVANGSVSSGMAPSTPVGLNAATVGDTDAQGHVRSMVKLTWTSNATSFPAETFFDHYEMEIQEDGDDYKALKIPATNTKHQFRAKIGKVYRFRIRACSHNGFKSAWTAWSAPNTVVTAAGDTVGPEKAVITSAVGKIKGMRLVANDCAATDYKRTAWYRYPSQAAADADSVAQRTFCGWGQETFTDNDLLLANTTYWYRAQHQDKSGNNGPKSDSFSGTTVTVDEADLSPNAPNAPTSVAFTTIATDIDDDGTLDPSLQIDWLAGTVDATHPSARLYEIQIWRSNSIGTNGSLTGYTKWRTIQSGDTNVVVEAKSSKFHKARVRAMNWSGVFSPWSAETNVGIKPNAKANDVATVSGVTAVARAKGNVVRWTASTAKDFKYYKVWRYIGTNSTPGSAVYIGRTTNDQWIDHDQTLVAGNVCWYYVTAVDTAGNESASKSAGASATFQLIQGDDVADSAIATAKIAPNAVTPSKAKLGDVTNLVRDSDMLDVSLWQSSSALTTSGTGFMTESPNRLTLASQTTTCEISTIPADIPVRQGKRYYFAGSLGNTTSVSTTKTMLVRWYSMGSTGALTYLTGQDSVVGVVTNTGMASFEDIVTAPTNARRAELVFQRSAAASATDFTVYAVNFHRAAGKETIPDGEIVESKVDATAPNKPSAPTLTGVTADIDGDGSIDTAIQITMTQPGGVPCKSFEIQLYKSDTSSGTYVATNRRATVPAEATGNTVFEMKVNQTKFWKAVYRGISFSGAKGAYSDQSAFAQAPQYLSTIPTPTVTVVPKAKGNFIKWTKWSNKTFKEAVIFRDGVEIERVRGNTWTDNEDLVAGTAYSYTVQFVDTQNRVGALSTAKTGTYRAVTGADINANAITARELLLTDFSNIADNGWSQGIKDGWVISGLQNWYLSTTTGDGDARGWMLQSNERDQAYSSWIAVNPGEVFFLEAWVSNLHTTAAASVILHMQKPDGTNQWLTVATTSTSGSWVLLSGRATVPTGFTKARMLLQTNRTAGSGGNSTFWSRPIMRRATDADMLDNAAVTEAKVDPTLPIAGAAPTLTSLVADIDGDGSPDLGFTCSWSAIAASGQNPAARLYEVEIWRRAGDKGTDGNNATGYTFWRKFVSVDTTVIFEAKRKYFHKARVRGLAFNNQSGSNWSPWLSVGVQPNKYDAMTGTTPTAPTATAVANGIYVSWTQPTDATYFETKLYQGATLIYTGSASGFLDQTVRTIGTGYTYTVVHYDRAGNFSNSSPASNSAIFRGLSGAESNINDPSSLAENNDLSLGPNIGWSNTSDVVNDATNAYRGSYVLRRQYSGAASSYTNRNKMLFPVRPGETYYIGGMVKTDSGWLGSNAGWRLSYTSDYAGNAEVATSPVAGLTAANTTWTEYGAFITVPTTATIAFARIEFVSYSQTAGAAYGSHCYVRPAAGRFVEAGAIKATQTDQTLPAALSAAPVASQVSVDVDDDGKIDIAVKWTWTKPTDTSNPIMAYQVLIYENGTLIDTFQTAYTTVTRKVKTRVNVSGSMVQATYYAIIQTVGFNGKLSAAGAFGQSNTVSPSKKAAVLAGTFAVGSLTVAQKDYGAYLSWARSGEPDYLETRIYRYASSADASANTNATDLGSIYGNWFQDMDVDIGTRYWYRIQHYDRSGNPGPLSSSVNLTVRGPSRKDNILVSHENLILDADCADLSQWTVTQSNNDLQRLDNTGNRGSGRYKLRVTGASVNFYSALIPVPARGGYYRFSCFAGPEDGVSYDVGVNFKYFYRDNSGNLVEGAHPDAPGGSSLTYNDTVQTVSNMAYLTVDTNIVGNWGIQFIQVKVRVLTAPASRQLNFASPTLIEMIDTAQLINESVTNNKLAALSVGTGKMMASAVTQKAQAYTNAGISVGTGGVIVQEDAVTWGSDFEWVTMEFSFYVGANASNIALTFEFMQGSTVLYTFQSVRPVNDMVMLKRAFGPSAFSGTSGNLRVRASTNTGTLSISDRQLISLVYKR